MFKRGVGRLAARAWWLATGRLPRGVAVPTVSREVIAGDPLTGRTAAALRATFDKCGLNVKLVGATQGPRITRFEIEVGPDVMVKKVLAIESEIAYAVGTENIRFLAPIPGRSAIGIEVERPDPQGVAFSEVLREVADPHPLTVALGRDIGGRVVAPNLATLPHLLVAGATGSGKSVCLNSIICSVASRATPEQVRMLLIDPKKVELTPYAKLPHLISPIVTDAEEAIGELEWVCEEMETRYTRLAAAGVRNIAQYNERAEQPMHYLLVVIDELADMMIVAKKKAKEGDDEVNVEGTVVRIAQLARAAGIHLVLATQRPSVDVVTGLIKANLPSRLAFAVSSGKDSEVILDTRGAEKLLGGGDGIFRAAGPLCDVRFQGAFLNEAEIEDVVRRACNGEHGVPEMRMRPAAPVPDADPLIKRAIEAVMRTRSGSTSALQRELKIGFQRAADIMAELESRGIVGPVVQGKARAVLAEWE